jgi:hypothetical protein
MTNINKRKVNIELREREKWTQYTYIDLLIISLSRVLLLVGTLFLLFF